MKKILLILILSAGIVSAQNSQSLVINGKVTDLNGEPLPYANVAFANNLRGTICNSSGVFKLLIPEKYQQDTLTFSFIGYKSKKVLISNITGSVQVMLQESSLALKEAVITSYTGEYLIEKAIGRIPENYHSNQYVSKGFYRVSTQTPDEYIHLSEAVFDIYHSTESSSKKPFRLDKMRAIKDENAAHGITIGQSPATLLSYDIVNSREDSELLSKKGMKNHQFILDGITTYEGIPVYKISFRKKLQSKKLGYSGFLYLDEKTLAFLYLETLIEDKDLHLVKFGNASTRLLMKMMDIKISLLQNETSISYKKIGNQYFLNRVFTSNKMSMKSDRENYDFQLDSKMNYVVTEIDIDHPRPFKNSETMAFGKQIEQLNSDFDSTFWKDYTIIVPDQDFGKIAKSISLKNEAFNHKEALANVIFKFDKKKSVRVDSILSYYNRKGLFNGNALIALNNEVIFEKSYNNALTNNRQNSQFRIGSTSKTFTAMLVRMLERAGKLNFNDPIKNYLPNYIHGQADIEQLLTHRSGIPDYLNDGMHLDQLYTKNYSIEELTNQFCSDTLEFAHGEQFDYSNSGYVLLAAIIEKVTDQSFGQVLKEMIFTPLKMNDSYLGEPGNVKNLTKGYLFNQPEPEFPILNTIGAGGITSTTRDLLKWSMALETDLLIPADDIQNNAWKAHAVYSDWNAFYGYGWMIDQSQFEVSKKHRVVYHPGTDNGFNSMFLKQPDEGITIVLLNNTGSFPRFDITDLILNELNR